jgi:hypothetical protein
MIVRDQHYVGRISTGMDLVRTAKCQDATVDPQTLFDDVKFEEVWWFDGSDALYQISPPVCAAHGLPNSGLVAFGSEWVGQQRAKKERWTPGNFLIENDAIPDRFRTGVEVSPRRDRFTRRLARE